MWFVDWGVSAHISSNLRANVKYVVHKGYMLIFKVKEVNFIPEVECIYPVK